MREAGGNVHRERASNSSAGVVTAARSGLVLRESRGRENLIERWL